MMPSFRKACVFVPLLTAPSVAYAEACPAAVVDAAVVKQQIVIGDGKASMHDGDYACSDHQNDCLSPTYLRKGAYLINGDHVINFAKIGSYSCVTFLNEATGAVTSGWVASDRLTDNPKPALPTSGTWVSRLGVPAKVEIKDDRMHLDIEEAFPLGATHDQVTSVASFAGDLRKEGEVWTSGTSGCSVQAVMLGVHMYLVGSDGCGGPGSSFNGFYKRNHR